MKGINKWDLEKKNQDNLKNEYDELKWLNKWGVRDQYWNESMIKRFLRKNIKIKENFNLSGWILTQLINKCRYMEQKKIKKF